jgi:hypothetical protein
MVTKFGLRPPAGAPDGQPRGRRCWAGMTPTAPRRPGGDPSGRWRGTLAAGADGAGSASAAGSGASCGFGCGFGSVAGAGTGAATRSTAGGGTSHPGVITPARSLPAPKVKIGGVTRVTSAPSPPAPSPAGIALTCDCASSLGRSRQLSDSFRGSLGTCQARRGAGCPAADVDIRTNPRFPVRAREAMRCGSGVPDRARAVRDEGFCTVYSARGA